MVTISVAHSDSHLEQILALQQRYLRRVLSADEENSQGFVYAQHDVPLLRKMAAELPQAIAVADGRQGHQRLAAAECTFRSFDV
jgi:hypothetical protein